MNLVIDASVMIKFYVPEILSDKAEISCPLKLRPRRLWALSHREGPFGFYNEEPRHIRNRGLSGI